MTDATADSGLDGRGLSQPRKKSRSQFMHWVLVTHRWLGLGAFVWIAVLGFTGVVLDHPEWRWAQQWTVTDKFSSDHVMDDMVTGNVIRYFQVNPANRNEMIGGGMRGMWHTTDAGQNWEPISFANYDGIPMVTTLLADRDDPWSAMWLATDDGLWLLSGQTRIAEQVALDGKHITSLDYSAVPGELAGIFERTTIFTLDPQRPETLNLVTPKDVLIPNLPDDVGWARFMIDLHLGDGFTGGRSSMWISDYAGVVMIILGITGLFYWLLPRRWKSPEKRHKVAKATRRTTLKWMYNLHSPVLGVLAIIPIVYLSITGIYIDHAEFFVPATTNKTLPRSFAPSAYELRDLSWQLTSLSTKPGAPGHYTVMTKMGLINSEDGGRSWTFDETTPLPAYKKNLTPGHIHKNGMQFVGIHGGPNYIKRDGETTWESIPALRMMVMHAVDIGDEWIIKGSRGFSSWRQGENAQALNITIPQLDGVPFNRFMADLHSGMVFFHEFVWINDIVCVIAIYLSITGFIAWWRKKWI